jgi:nitrogen regulatory protein P-II 2
MTTYPMKLVTVVCEALAREPLLRVFKESGAHGYTLFPVEGAGAQGERPGDIAEFGNIQAQVVVTADTAQTILARLHQELFPRFAMIAYSTDVQVIRSGKF